MRTIIIDVNNLLYKVYKYKRTQGRDSGRDDRISLVEKIKSRLGNRVKVIFVFDGFGDIKNRSVIFSGKKTADEVIREYVKDYKNPKLLSVVSSDQYITRFAKVCGCSVQSSEEFWQSVKEKDSITKDKNINQNFIYDEDEKPSVMSKKDLEEFRKYFT